MQQKRNCKHNKCNRGVREKNITLDYDIAAVDPDDDDGENEKRKQN